MKLLQNLKKNKKGFTLIEMIVVIVIIGILLAILIPGMFKYIDKAKNKQIEVNARTAYLNMTTAIAELYGENGVTASLIENVVEATNATFSNDSTKGKLTLTVTVNTKPVAVDIEPFPNDIGVVSGVKVVIPDKDSKKFEITDMTYTEDTKSISITAGVWDGVK